MVPADASVSASYNMLTHLSHRTKVYMFTSPFKPAYWGINGENLPQERPEYLVLDMPLLSEDARNVLDSLEGNRTYVRLHSQDGITVWKKASL